MLKYRNPTRLWRRKCNLCKKEIDSTFAPDRPENVVCQECYKGQIQ